jgi:hypothetical protein
MPDRSDEFRKLAAECVTIARSTSDPVTRASLLMMAQRWYDLANGPSIDFDAIQRDFNDRQMSGPATPVMQQQQQQVQPKNKK